MVDLNSLKEPMYLILLILGSLKFLILAFKLGEITLTLSFLYFFTRFGVGIKKLNNNKSILFFLIDCTHLIVCTELASDNNSNFKIRKP